MIKNQKIIFLYALILTVIVFNLGIFMGYMLETSRINKINTIYLNDELSLLDQIIQKSSIDRINASCEGLIKENIKFADRIYEEGLTIERYENANRINNEIIFQHKRIDLLRTFFFMNSLEIKDKCNSNYNIIVYFYQYNNPDIQKSSKQRFFSDVLMNLKQKYGSNIMLIPLSGDNDIPSINLIMDNYNITYLPSILINEKTVLTDIKSIDEIEKYLN
ncbi:hypothetical protein GYA25_01695 [Candidatus Woesearchaeota archaeon]|nr:hypothetical protein [Candidatus Woesearchaeota archaeon]